jgi:hypothetical protein
MKWRRSTELAAIYSAAELNRGLSNEPPPASAAGNFAKFTEVGSLVKLFLARIHPESGSWNMVFQIVPGGYNDSAIAERAR